MSVPAQLERYFCIWAGLGGDERTLGKAHPWTTCKNCTRQVADDFISSRMSTVPKQSLTIMVKMKTLHRKSLRRKMCTLSRRVWLFVTPCTVACQAPLSMGFPRQESWSGLPFPLQGIFLIWKSEPGLLHLLHWQAHSLSPSYLGNTKKKNKAS